MAKHTFEDFLMEKHADQYVGTDDCMVDDFNDWLNRLGIDEIIEYADKFVKKLLGTGKIVIWKDGTWLYAKDGITWEYENDPNWLLTIDLSKDLLTPEQKKGQEAGNV